jgi:EAL domain-containing protein (putative c-di-GMP-specific phosphodiesterase class I)/GGDEF domain-containing protein
VDLLPKWGATVLSDNAARYLGFAFASAELLFELDADGRIALSIGALQKLLGASHETVAGKSWSSLFAPESQPVVAALLESLDTADRRGPVRVELAAMEGRKLKRFVAFSACRLPQLSPNVSCAISLGGASVQVEAKGPNGLHDQASFMAAADGLMANPTGIDLDVAFVEFRGLSQAATAMGPEAGQAAIKRVAAAVQAESLGGQAAGQLADDRFALVRPKSEAPDRMLQRLTRAAERAGAPVEVSGSNASLDAAPTGESMRALRFALDSFIKDGAGAAGEAFSDVLANTQAQARAFSRTVSERRFRLFYQPIIDLKTMELHHFETLARLQNPVEESPAEAIRLAEELELIHELDMAVVDLCIRRLTAPNNGRLKLASNLSARSLARPEFIPTLLKKAQAHPGIADRLIFEITESAEIQDLEAANRQIQALRTRGFTVCLDDFGAGAAALSYLRSLAVDTVKIDGQYVRDIATAGRADAVVRHLVELCRELEVTTVAEMVETEKAAAVLRDIGVDYGQGYYFGRPAPEPIYAKPAPAVARRMGATEGWR